MLANSVNCVGFVFVVNLIQLAAHDWRYEGVARVFGASSARAFYHGGLSLFWPGLLSAFILAFLLAFNEFEITYFNIGAVPTLPTVAWGSLRHGLRPELYAFSVFVMSVVGGCIAVLALLIRFRFLQARATHD